MVNAEVMNTGDRQSAKRPYRTPTLTLYGAVRDLTCGNAGTAPEGMSGMVGSKAGGGGRGRSGRGF